MKKLLFSGLIAVFLLPNFALAAFDDVGLAKDVVLSVNGITLNISGSTATIASIVVNPTTFVVTVQAGSSFQVTAPNLNKLEKSSEVGLVVDTCNASNSILGYTTLTGSSELAITITPSTTLCAEPTTVTGSGSSAGVSSSSATSATVPVVAQVVTPVTTNAEAIAVIKTQLVSLIQQLIVLLNQELQTMQASQ